MGQRETLAAVIIAIATILAAIIGAIALRQDLCFWCPTPTPTPTQIVATPVPTLTQEPTKIPVTTEPTPPPVTIEPSPIPATIEPTATPVPTESSATPVPTPQHEEVVGIVTVQAKAVNGDVYQIQQAGNYAVEIESGAYSPWGDNSIKNGQWRAFAYIYKNRVVKRGNDVWGSGVPIDPDFIIGCYRDMGSQGEAEECGTGQRLDVGALQSGDALRLVALDELQAYPENRGSLIVKIIKLP